MKKYIKLLILVLVISMILPGLAHAIPRSGKQEYVTVLDLNLRMTADDTARPAIYVEEGQLVEYLGREADGWFKLRYKGRIGYTHRGNVTSKENYESTGEAKIHNIKISAANHREYKTVIDINLRTGDASQYRSIALMEEGSSVIHLGQTANGWFKVKYKEKEGYIYRGDLTSKENYNSTEGAKIHNFKLAKGANGKEYVNIIDLNLRTGNENKFRSIALLERGSSVIHLGETGNGWFKVKSDNKEGYIYRGDLTSKNNYNVLSKVDEGVYKLLLEESIKKAKALDESDYPKEILGELQRTISEGEILLKDINTSQESVDNGFDNIEEAFKDLKILEEKYIKTRMDSIQGEWSKLKSISKEVKYIENPKVNSPYKLGKLTKETTDNALKMTNFIRYIAYLPNDVLIDENFNTHAQAASLVNAANGVLTHYPAKPSAMEEALYSLGSLGARTSNIGYGYSNIIDSIVYGYMEDGDRSNIDVVGHRRWILSPKLKKLGFGFTPVSSGSSRAYTAMKVIEDNMESNSQGPYDYISWPAKTAMPIEHFTEMFPWSVSLNTEKYRPTNLDKIKVELIRLNDNKKWEFSKKSADGFFNIDTGNYGNLPFTIIFGPTGKPTYKAGDKYKLTISNLTRVDGGVEDLSFKTSFFNLK